MPCPSCGAPGEPETCPACGDAIWIAGRYRMTERVGSRVWRALDAEDQGWVAMHQRREGQVPPEHPALAPVVDVLPGWVVQRWVDGDPIAEGDGSWLEAAVGVLDALEVLHDAGLAHGSVDPDHLVRAADGEVVLLGVPQGERAADDLSDLASLLDRRLGTSASGDARRLLDALDRQPAGVAEVYRHLANPTWAEPLPIDEPEPFVAWMEPAEAREARVRKARKRARPLFAVAALILLAGGWSARPGVPTWTLQHHVPEGLEPVAASLTSDAGLQACLAGADPGAVAAVLTVDRDPTRFRPARYRVDATDPTIARCVLRTATSTLASEEPGRWTLVVPLRREG